MKSLLIISIIVLASSSTVRSINELPDLLISPSSLVIQSSRLTIICHHNPRVTRLELTKNYQVVLEINENATLKDQWKERDDIQVAIQQEFVAIKLLTDIADTGRYTCVTYYESGLKKTSKPAKLTVGFAPSDLQLNIILDGENVDWLADKHQFTIECSCKSGIPVADVKVKVAGYLIDGIKSSYASKRTKFVKNLEAAPVLNGEEVTCQAENAFGKTEIKRKTLVVRYTSHNVIVANEIKLNKAVEIDQEGGILVCSGGGIPSPSGRWIYKSGMPDGKVYFKPKSKLLQISRHLPLGEYKLICSVTFPTGSTSNRTVNVKIIPRLEDSFHPNVVAILFGVFLSISVLINFIFGALLYKIYSQDEKWNSNHQYSHIPIKKWVNNNVT